MEDHDIELIQGKDIAPTLIQRLKPPIKNGEAPNPFTFGGGLRNGGFSDEAYRLVNKAFSFDYMGAGEFENGIIPATLGRMYKHFLEGRLIQGKVSITKLKGGKIPPKQVYYLCHPLIENTVKKFIKKLALKDYEGLKRPTLFQSSLKDGKVIGWLVPDYDFAFFIDGKTTENTIQLLETVKKSNMRMGS